MITNRDLVNQMSNDDLAFLMGDRCKHCVHDFEECKGDCETGHALWLAAEAEPDKTEKFCADCIYFSDEKPIPQCLDCTNKANYKRAVKLENCSEDVIDNDPVNHPSHYCKGGIECIDAIEASMTPEQFGGYLKGNIEKYIWRYEIKGGLQDLEKAMWYLDRLIKHRREYGQTN